MYSNCFRSSIRTGLKAKQESTSVKISAIRIIYDCLLLCGLTMRSV